MRCALGRLEPVGEGVQALLQCLRPADGLFQRGAGLVILLGNLGDSVGCRLATFGPGIPVTACRSMALAAQFRFAAHTFQRGARIGRGAPGTFGILAGRFQRRIVIPGLRGGFHHAIRGLERRFTIGGLAGQAFEPFAEGVGAGRGLGGGFAQTGNPLLGGADSAFSRRDRTAGALLGLTARGQV